MNDAKFYLLGKLIKEHRTITRNGYRTIVYNDSKLKESIDYKEFNDEDFFTDAFEAITAGKGGLHDEFRIKNEYEDIYSEEVKRRNEKEKQIKLQDELTKSTINANLFIKLSIGLSAIALIIQFISVLAQQEQSTILQEQFQLEQSQIQKMNLQDCLLIQHSRELEILKASLQKKENQNPNITPDSTKK